jgi:hypothetical protein
MQLAIRGKSNDPTVPSQDSSETVSRAEEALRRAMQWADWMEAADKARQE